MGVIHVGNMMKLLLQKLMSFKECLLKCKFRPLFMIDKEVLLLILLCFSQTTFSQEVYTIITDVNVFTGETYFENTNLVFKDGVILRINKNVANYPNQKIIDGKGKTIIPPLLNAHVHIQSEENLKESLKFGIFANLDMYGSDEYSNFLRTFSGTLEYSEYYSPNSGATVPKGHGTEYGMEVPTINDSTSPSQFVADRIKYKADYIKIVKEPLMVSLRQPSSTFIF